MVIGKGSGVPLVIRWWSQPAGVGVVRNSVLPGIRNVVGQRESPGPARERHRTMNGQQSK